MNFNSLMPQKIKLESETMIADVNSFNKNDLQLTIKQKIDLIQIIFTNSAKFGKDCPNVEHDIEKIEFDLIGIDPCISNTLRRIMLAEVPQMAFERVLIYNNTSLIQVYII